MNSRLYMFSWFMVFAWFGMLVLWVFPRAYYGLSDNMLTLTGTRAIMHGLQNQDFRLILRPGYLLNVPLMALGFNQMALKITCLILELAAFITFLLSYSRAILKSPVFPLCLLLMGTMYMMPFQMFLNYYSSMVIFLMLGFAAFWRVNDQPRLHWLWIVLCALCFALAVMSNLAIIWGVSIVMIAYLAIERSTKALALVILYALILGMLLWLYLDVAQAWSVFETYALPSHSRQEVESMFLAAGTMFLVFLAIAAFFYLSETSESRFFSRYGTLIVSIVLMLLMLFPPVLWEPGLFFFAKQFYLAYVISVSCIWGLVLLLKRKLPKASMKRIWLVFVAMALIGANYRSVSHGHFISALFLSPLWAVLIFEIYQSYQFKFKHSLLVLFCVCSLIIPVTQVYFYFGIDEWIGINQKMAPSGVMTDPYTYQMEHDLLKAYDAHGCAHKPFYAFYVMARAYWITHRQPLFNDAYVTPGSFQLKNRFETNAGLKHYFSERSHWCVLAQVGHNKGRLEPFIGWLKQNSTEQTRLSNSWLGSRNTLYSR